MVEIIIGSVVTILTAVVRYLLPKYLAKDLRDSLVVFSAFFLTLLGVGLYYLLSYRQMIPEGFIETVYQGTLLAVGTYEVIYKQVIKKIIDSL